MLGAVVGSFVAGFFADRCGRKPAVVGRTSSTGSMVLYLGTMLVLVLSHAFMLFYGKESAIYAITLFFVLGCASGGIALHTTASFLGYMVTNLVLMVESLEKARSRLLVVSLNGWPVGMAYVALISYLSGHWKTFHIIMSLTALALYLILVRVARI